MKKITTLLTVIFIIILLVISFNINNTDKRIKVTGAGNIKIACLGDSITYGYGIDRDKCWVSLLPKMLGEDYQSINYGLISRTLLSTGNYPYFKEEMINNFWNDQEDIIIFMLGSNDTKINNWDYDRFEKEYKQLIERFLKKKKESKLYIMIPPQIFNNDVDELPNRDNLEKGVIPIINNLKEQYNLKVIDLYSLTKDHEDWYIDTIHPNEIGHREIAKEIMRVIRGDS